MAKKKKTQNVLESPVPLSKSIVWEMQRRYYDRQSLKAWSDGSVPFWITSNPLIARTYSQLIGSFLRDCQSQKGPKKSPIDLNEPIYLVELGSGTGQHGWHLIRELQKVSEFMGFDRSLFKVILTDFTESNLEAWEKNEIWKPLLEKGLVDFALFDADHPNDLQLRNSKITLKKGSQKNPVILIANYLFDTIRHDAFCVENKQIFETRVSLAYDKSGEPDLDQEDLFDHMDFKETKVELGEKYYEEPIWNSILKDYHKAFESTDFLMPIGALKVIRHFMDLSNQRLMLICGDKLYRDEDELSEGVGAHLTPHGSFSIMVNGDAIGKYFERRGGKAFHCDHGDLIFLNSVFVLDQASQSNELRDLTAGFETLVNGFNPSDYIKVFEDLPKRHKKASLEIIVSLLRMSHWDSDIFLAFEDRIEETLKKATPAVALDFHKSLLKIWDHHFPLDDDEDIAFKLARLLYAISDYNKALELFSFSHRHAGDHHATYFNLGLCYDKLGQRRKALDHYQKALKLKPDYDPALKEMAKLNKKK